MEITKENETETEKETIRFQYIMNSKAYRRGMMLFRITATVIAVGGTLAICAFSVVLGIISAVIVGVLGALTVIVALGNEQTYTVYNTRIVLKRRGDYSRKSVPMQSITAVKCKSAFYEKNMCVGTVTVKAKTDKGSVKSYKLKHIFDYKPLVKYLNEIIDGRNTNAG